MVEQLTENRDCATRWPLFLVHGIAIKQAERLRYWGRIPETLRQRGATVCISRQDAWGSAESNAQQLRTRLFEILQEQQTDKVNIIGHSKGGIDARVLATLPGCAEHIASITTIATPHHGARGLDWIYHVPSPIKWLAGLPVDIALILLGEDNPHYVQAWEGVGAKAMEEFNQRYPLPKDIPLQSYAAVQNRLPGDLFFLTITPLVLLLEGPNDGLVPQHSAQYGDFKGTINAEGRLGLSHIECSDTGRSPRARKLSRDGFDVLAWWVELVRDLKSRGY
ncbi:MAG: hypothetical protein FWF91_07565 [Coriobacteriia bacterium]|nr:hypothetical protein [Coriobacteriia bacterium]